MKLLFWVITALLLLAIPRCLFAQTAQDTIVVLPQKIAIPEYAKKIGAVKAGNNATETHCNYEAVIAEAKEKAGAMGGNVVKITELVAPSFVSKCYAIKADVYSAGKLRDSVMAYMKANNTQVSPATGYGLLYIYRLQDTVAFAQPYKVHVNDDSVICTVKSRSMDSVKIYKEGPLTLWAETEARAELKLDMKFGQAYYVRCGLRGGQFRKIPVLESVNEGTGAAEFKNGRTHKKDQSVKYLMEIH